MGSNHEKNGGRKSCDTLSLRKEEGICFENSAELTAPGFPVMA